MVLFTGPRGGPAVLLLNNDYAPDVTMLLTEDNARCILPNVQPIHHKGMSSDQLNEYLRELRWSGAELSRRLGVTPKAVSEWRRGKRPVPGPVRAYIRLVVAVTVALREGEGTP